MDLNSNGTRNTTKKEKLVRFCTMSSRQFSWMGSCGSISTLLQLFHDNIRYKKTLKKLMKPNTEWQNEVLFFIRFYCNIYMLINNNSINFELMSRYRGWIPHPRELRNYTFMMYFMAYCA